MHSVSEIFELRSCFRKDTISHGTWPISSSAPLSWTSHVPICNKQSYSYRIIGKFTALLHRSCWLLINVNLFDVIAFIIMLQMSNKMGICAAVDIIVELLIKVMVEVMKPVPVASKLLGARYGFDCGPKLVVLFKWGFSLQMFRYWCHHYFKWDVRLNELILLIIYICCINLYFGIFCCIKQYSLRI